jgi:hypothetical protein
MVVSSLAADAFGRADDVLFNSERVGVGYRGERTGSMGRILLPAG